MKHPVSRELFAYWDRLRQGRAAPERAEIDPAAIRGVLSDTFIIGADTRTDPASFPVRLSGTRLNALFLGELKGRSMLDLWLPEDQPAVARLFETVLDDAAPVVAGLRASPRDQRPIDLEMLLLPLRHGGRTHARILGAIAPLKVPSWLGLVAIERLALTSLRLLAANAVETSPARLRVGERDEPTASPAMAPRRYGRFTVHTGGR